MFYYLVNHGELFYCSGNVHREVSPDTPGENQNFDDSIFRLLRNDWEMSWCHGPVYIDHSNSMNYVIFHLASRSISTKDFRLSYLSSSFWR